MKRYYYLTVYDDVEIKIGVNGVRSGKKVSSVGKVRNRVLNRDITHVHTILLSDGSLISTTCGNKLFAVQQTIKDMSLFEDLSTFNKHIMKVDGERLSLKERIEIAEHFENSKTWHNEACFAKYVLADGFKVTA